MQNRHAFHVPRWKHVAEPPRAFIDCKIEIWSPCGSYLSHGVPRRALTLNTEMHRGESYTEVNESNNLPGPARGPRKGGHFNRRGPETFYTIAKREKTEEVAIGLREYPLENTNRICKENMQSSTKHVYGQSEEPSAPEPPESSDPPADDPSAAEPPAAEPPAAEPPAEA